MSSVTDTTIAVYDMKVDSFQGDSESGSQIVLAPNWERAEKDWRITLPLAQGLNGLKVGDEVKLHIEKYD